MAQSGNGPTWRPWMRIPAKPTGLPFELMALAAGLVLLIWRLRAWQPRLLGTGWCDAGGCRDQPVLAAAGICRPVRPLLRAGRRPLAPLLAAMVSRSVLRPRFSSAWAIALLGVGLVAYVVGQQDYTSWQVARDIAARSAYAQAPAIEVQAGYEEVAQHVWVPAANDATLPRDLVPHPMIYLAFAGPDDTRPGVSYFSLAPGRIIIVRAR